MYVVITLYSFVVCRLHSLFSSLIPHSQFSSLTFSVLMQYVQTAVFSLSQQNMSIDHRHVSVVYLLHVFFVFCILVYASVVSEMLILYHNIL